MNEEPKQVIVERERRSSVGTIVAVVIAIIVVLALLMYGLPYLTGGNNSTTNVNVPSPAVDSGTNGN